MPDPPGWIRHDPTLRYNDGWTLAMLWTRKHIKEKCPEFYSDPSIRVKLSKNKITGFFVIGLED